MANTVESMLVMLSRAFQAVNANGADTVIQLNVTGALASHWNVQIKAREPNLSKGMPQQLTTISDLKSAF